MTPADRRRRIKRRVRIRRRGLAIASGVERDVYSVWGEIPDAIETTVNIDDTKP